MPQRDSSTRRAAIVRIGLGFAQMLAAAFALGLLITERTTNRALAAVVLAGTLTALSFLRHRGPRKP